jgi:hypothetical protein
MGGHGSVKIIIQRCMLQLALACSESMLVSVPSIRVDGCSVAVKVMHR